MVEATDRADEFAKALLGRVPGYLFVSEIGLDLCLVRGASPSLSHWYADHFFFFFGIGEDEMLAQLPLSIECCRLPRHFWSMGGGVSLIDGQRRK